MSQNDAPGGVLAPVSLLTPAHWWPQVVNSTPEEMKACGDGRLKSYNLESFPHVKSAFSFSPAGTGFMIPQVPTTVLREICKPAIFLSHLIFPDMFLLRPKAAAWETP